MNSGRMGDYWNALRELEEKGYVEFFQIRSTKAVAILVPNEIENKLFNNKDFREAIAEKTEKEISVCLEKYSDLDYLIIYKSEIIGAAIRSPLFELFEIFIRGIYIGSRPKLDRLSEEIEFMIKEGEVDID